jgi:hypothetical protein
MGMLLWASKYAWQMCGNYVFSDNLSRLTGAAARLVQSLPYHASLTPPPPFRHQRSDVLFRCRIGRCRPVRPDAAWRTGGGSTRPVLSARRATEADGRYRARPAGSALRAAAPARYQSTPAARRLLAQDHAAQRFRRSRRLGAAPSDADHRPCRLLDFYRRRADHPRCRGRPQPARRAPDSLPDRERASRACATARNRARWPRS